MQKTNAIQHQKDKQSSLKNGQSPEQTLLQGAHTELPDTYEEMFNITNHQSIQGEWEKKVKTAEVAGGTHFRILKSAHDKVVR